MVRDGFFTGLDIGSSSIKVLVAEFVNGELNIIGVSNAKSAGVKDGIIINIEVAASAIRKALKEAEEKAGVAIDKVSVGLPANLLQIEPAQGMIPVTSNSQEITDQDVDNVIKSSLTKNMTPEREIVAFVPEEFMVDSFAGIKDPRGMMGIRLEVHGLLYTGPKTILHNLRKTVSQAGVAVDNIIISPLAIGQYVLNEGEREFGTTVIDLGGGQTTVACVSNQKLVYTNVYQEGGDYVTKDISKVLTTSQSIAENLKYNFGIAYPALASHKETMQVDVIGESSPKDITEVHLSEIIAARLQHILDRVKQDLDRTHNLDLPGGIVLIGGGATIPGVVELAQDVFNRPVKLYVPNQIGIRNPAFAHVISIVEYAGNMDDIEQIAQAAVNGEEYLRSKPIDVPNYRPAPQGSNQQIDDNPYVAVDDMPNYAANDDDDNRQKLGDKVRGIFGSMFE
ncbi:cell division protein FtsA [Streptococcus moroccensis]|uniref:Cell division protein FtsA n=1 Tax=Streptococcus moroccensis TaxID=1451356 RepID=A0ABT9YNY4_9STRE|nr:cell division protein FtsA [Streptococcus moroccensis]MDQ0221490.1 cell division protein FtsA [Streptococcus moroccensis]